MVRTVPLCFCAPNGYHNTHVFYRSIAQSVLHTTMSHRKSAKSSKRPGLARAVGRYAARSNRSPRGRGRPYRNEADTSGKASSELPGERLQKVLAAAGVASRRESEQLILEGRVEVDGQIVTTLGTRVDRFHQAIFVDGEPLPRPKLVYYAVNKPVGVVCTARDPAGRPRVTDLLPPDVGRVFNVGRLDLSSEGLILVTNDGELANKLTHPRHGVPKTYEVQIAGDPPPEVVSQLRRGMHLAEAYVKPVDVRVKSRKSKSTILEMVLDEGRNREIRRLLACVGHKVQRLTRIAVGPIRLGELPRGACRPLTRTEIDKLREATSHPHRSNVSATSTPQQSPPRTADRMRKRKAARGKALAGARNRRGKNVAGAKQRPRTADKRAPRKRGKH